LPITVVSKLVAFASSIILVPVVDDEHKLIGLVGRLDILQQNLSEKFVTIGERSDLSEASSPG